MEDLVRLDEEHWRVDENINHIQLFRKENWDDKGKLKSICEGDLIYGCPKQLKSKEVNLNYLWKGVYKVHTSQTSWVMFW
jgi:hypothetical protein